MGSKILKYLFTSSIASKGPCFGGGITSGIELTISGLIKFWFSGRTYLAVFATPYEIATTGLLSVLKASPTISSSMEFILVFYNFLLEWVCA